MFVNDKQHKNANSTMKLLDINNSPHLCLFATKKINLEEIRYDYGWKDAPWRMQVCFK